MPLVPSLSRTSAVLVGVLSAVVLSAPGPTGAAPKPAPNAPPPSAPAPNAPAPNAPANVTWAVQPSSPSGPTGRNYFSYDLAPGSELTDHVGISNLSDRPLTFAVYGTDAQTTVDGAFALLPADRPATDVGSWIRFDRRSHTVAPGQRVDIPFRLTVPANATPGDHAGGVIGAIAQTRTAAGGQRVTVDQRIAARVYLRVAGESRPAVTIESVAVAYDNPLNPLGGGAAVVTYRLRNSGNIRLGGSGSVAVNGPFGWRLADTDRVDLPELLPGASFTVTERITGVPPALRLTAEVDLAVTTIDTALPPVLRSSTVWAPPWLLLAGAAGVAGWSAVRWWRRRRAVRPVVTGVRWWRRRRAVSPMVPGAARTGAAPASPTAPTTAR